MAGRMTAWSKNELRAMRQRRNYAKRRSMRPMTAQERWAKGLLPLATEEWKGMDSDGNRFPIYEIEGLSGYWRRSGDGDRDITEAATVVRSPIGERVTQILSRGFVQLPVEKVFDDVARYEEHEEDIPF